MRFIQATLMLSVLSICSTQVFGHYLWVTIDGKAGEYGTTNVYFEGGPRPGDGQYLDPFVERGTTWLRSLQSDGVAKLDVKDTKVGKNRWLQAALPTGGSRSVESYGKWGVYRYGKIDVLLDYYAKNIEAATKRQRVALGLAKQQALDIVPVASDAGDVFQILWQGKPLAGSSVKIRGGVEKSAKTDKAGRITVQAAKTGQVTLHATLDEKESGTDNGKDFSLKRHHATLVLKLTAPKTDSAI